MIVDNISDLTEILRKLSFEYHEQWREEFEFVLADAADTIESLYKKQSVNEWIPCSEKLPEANKDVLICFSDGDVHIASRTHEEFSDFIDRECNIFKNVVAWQLLPEPYKSQDS